MTQRTEFLPTRRSLLTRLKRWDDEQGWREFFDTYWKLVYSVARKSGLHQSEAEEVVQETVISVAKQMPGFKYDAVGGSFKSWLLQIVRRRIADQFRKRAREVSFAEEPSATGTAPMARVPDRTGTGFEQIWEIEFQKNLTETALEIVKRRANPAQFQLFELHVMKEWPVNRIASTMGVTANQVYLAKSRVGKLAAAELKRLRARLT